LPFKWPKLLVVINPQPSHNSMIWIQFWEWKNIFINKFKKIEHWKMSTRFQSPSKQPRFSIITNPTLQSQSNNQHLVSIVKEKRKILIIKKCWRDFIISIAIWTVKIFGHNSNPQFGHSFMSWIQFWKLKNKIRSWPLRSGDRISIVIQMVNIFSHKRSTIWS